MTADLQPWKAAPDVFVVTRPAAAFVDALKRAAAELSFESPDPDCRFYSHARVTDTDAGPAVVLTDVAEYASGVRHSAVVVSAVVHDDEADERLVVIRTHLEDQHTRHEGDRIVFEAHHDAMRAALVGAVLAVEPGAGHRSRPLAPTVSTSAPVGRVVTQSGPNVQRAQRRAEAAVVAAPPARVDVRQIAGIGCLAVGVLVLLLSIAFGSLFTIIGGVGVAGLLGYVGKRIGGA